MPLLWFIRYLFLGLKCEIPIVEAFWISADRYILEEARILARIKYQLLSWGYLLEEGSALTSYYLGGTTMRLTPPLTFHVTLPDYNPLPHYHEFIFIVSYPRNFYFYKEGSSNGVYLTSRREWLEKLLGLLGEEEITPCLLDFTNEDPLHLWLAWVRRPSEWVEIQ